jgi:tetratricopeptide (TPR) repeat protein
MQPGSRTSFLRSSPAFWLFVLAFLARLFVLIRFSGSLHFLPDGDDMKFYSDWALRIAHGQWTDHQAFYGLPGYAYCLALIFTLVGGFDPFTIGVIQALMDSGIAILIYKIARLVFTKSVPQSGDDSSLGSPDFIGIGAASAWIVFTPAQTFSAILMPTVWLVFAYYFCVWIAVKTRESSWWKPWLVLGLFAGFVSMLVATILFAVPLLIVAIILSVERPTTLWTRMPKIIAAIAVLIAGLYVGAAPAWIHNYFIAHEPVMLSAHSGINFWIGNNPVASGYPKMPPGIRATQDGLLRDSITLAERAAGRKLTRAEVSKYWSRQANDYIRQHKVAWLRLMAVKFGNFWNSYQYDDLSIIKLLQDEGIVPPGLRFGFIAALGLAGLAPCVWRFPRARWVAAAVLLHMCALMPVFVTERYRLAAAPGLMILGAGGLALLWENLARSRWLAAAAYCATGAAAAWFVSIPREDVGLWSLDHYKAGIRATAAGDLDRAQRNLETAFAYVQNNAEINFALGNLWFARTHESGVTDAAIEDDRRRARIFYKRALDLNPRHVGTLNNAGVLELEEKRWSLAERFFLASLDAEPEDAKSYYLLARARFEMGRMDDAKSALDEALRRRPNQKEFLELRDKLTPPSAAALPAPPPPVR